MDTNNNTSNYYKAAFTHPYHLSVGIVVFTKERKILCHHYPNIDELKDIYTIPAKTLQPNETPESAAYRAALDELGINIDRLTYIGSKTYKDIWFGELKKPTAMEKGVIYFLAHTSETPKAPDNAQFSIKEMEPQKLFEILQKQPVKDGMRDFSPAEIVERATLIQSL